MRSSEKNQRQSPWPGAAGQVRKRIVSAVGLCGLVVVCAVGALAMRRSGDAAAQAVSKYVALFGLALIFVLALGIIADLRIAHRSAVRTDRGHDIPATVVPGSSVYFGLYQAFWLCFATIFITAAVEIAGAAWRTHWPLVVIFAGIGLFSGSAPALALTGRLRRGRIALTETEIIHYGWSSQSSLAWGDLLKVGTAFERAPLIIVTGVVGAEPHYTTPSLKLNGKTKRLWQLDRLPLAGWIFIECPRFSVNGSMLYHYLTFYAENPAARAELGTASSVDRWCRLSG
ncbi:stage III sporulation AC/AD family protein [Nocardia sp. NPDC127579]|uniref:stage III sporulation AC/AD family protein n=1 Tax=Nocardia sp. NPDC127579 TaxID=3345402 RepID=UPI00363002DF